MLRIRQPPQLRLVRRMGRGATSCGGMATRVAGGAGRAGCCGGGGWRTGFCGYAGCCRTGCVGGWGRAAGCAGGCAGGCWRVGGCGGDAGEAAVVWRLPGMARSGRTWVASRSCTGGRSRGVSSGAANGGGAVGCAWAASSTIPLRVMVGSSVTSIRSNSETVSASCVGGGGGGGGDGRLPTGVSSSGLTIGSWVSCSSFIVL